MTNDEVVAHKARQIAWLENALTVHRQAVREIKAMLVSIGGPLNGNKLRYSHEQLMIFHRIEQALPAD